MKRISNSISFKTLRYFVLFSIIILVVLWLLQVVSLNKFYELSVKNEISDVVEKVKENYNSDDYEDYLNRLSFQNNMCIEIYDGVAISYSSIGCYKEGAKLTDEKRDFIFNNTQEKEFIFVDQKMKSNYLMEGIKLENGKFAFVQVRLEPVDSTVKILKDQLLVISIFVCLLSILLAVFLSRRISKPIEKMNANAKKIASGEYEVDFEENSTVNEINELNKTLNITSKELQKTENLRRELMSNVSHDLKTPLTMIKAYAEMIRDLTYKDKKKMKENLNVIIEESDRLNLLVNDILELSRYQSNTIKLEYDDFDINELILEILNRFKIYEEQDGFKITYKKSKKCIVHADRKRIEQVLYNLLNNAINYSNEDKKIEIKLIEEENVKIEISNSCDKLSDEELNLIWDKYYKVDKTYSRVQLGTGIGLSIVKNILELHNSNYGVRQDDKKITFYFDILKTLTL